MNEFARKCPACGKVHDWALQDTKTGEVLARVKKCMECLRAEWFSPHFDPKTYNYDIEAVQGQVIL